MSKDKSTNSEMNMRCIICGMPAQFDICKPCTELMKDLHNRQRVYDRRYASYVVDHGRAEFEFVDSYINPGSVVLELGAGNGHLSHHCRTISKNIITLDFSEHMIRTSKRSYPELNVCVADAEKYLPFKDSSFDVIICSEVFEHLFSAYSNVQEIHRILKNTGIYIIKTPNRNIENIYNFLINRNNYYHKSFHQSTQSMESLKKLLVVYGFKPQFIRQIELSDTQVNKIPWKRIRKIIGYTLQFLPRSIQSSLVCVARKGNIKR